MFQIAQEEKTFAEEFLSCLEILKEPLTPELDEGDDLLTPAGLLEYVFYEGLLRDLHESLRPYCPFETKDFCGLAGVPEDPAAAIVYQREIRKTLQSIEANPVAAFDKIYTLDFYLGVFPQVLGSLPHDGVPTFIRYLIHLREGFFAAFRNSLESRVSDGIYC